MKTAMLSILVLFVFISESTFGLPNLNGCLEKCQSEFDFCDDNCGNGALDCDECDSILTSCGNDCHG